MHFKQFESKDWLNRTKNEVQITHGGGTIEGAAAYTGARALAVTGSEWEQEVYMPTLDEAAISELQGRLGRSLQDELGADLRREIESASIHLSRLAGRKTLMKDLFGGNLEKVQNQQGNIGTCYLIAPNVTLHHRPELLWALLPHLFERTGKDRYRVNIPSASKVHGVEYPNTIDIPDFTAHLQGWRDQFHTKGMDGDIAIEAAYASMISRGDNGRQFMTRRPDSAGKIPVEGGFPEEAFASLMPRGWTQRHYSLPLQGMTPEQFTNEFGGPRTAAYFWISTYEHGKVRMDGVNIRKRHAYTIGHVSKGIAFLYNPHNPQDRLTLSVQSLINCPNAYLGVVQLTLQASPLMEHTRMVQGLPSEEYQIRYLRNVLASSRGQLHKLLCVKKGSGELSKAAVEFSSDPQFGPLFQKVQLGSFIDAVEKGGELPFEGFTLPPKSPSKERSGILGKMGVLGLGLSAGAAAVISLSLAGKDPEPTCLPSVPGEWSLYSGKDVLGNEGTVDYTVRVAKKGAVRDAVQVSNYPSVCLQNQAPRSVAAHMPVVNDMVRVSSKEGEGLYHFFPKMTDTEKKRLRIKSGKKVSITAQVGAVEIQCNGTRKEPILIGCLDDIAFAEGKLK